MDSDRPENTASKARPNGPLIPGVEIITTASQRASRKMTAVQRTPVGRRIYEVLRNLVWVVPLTVLVWLYAEREQVEPPQRIAFSITVTSGRADRIVTLANPADQVLSIEIEGTKPRIEQVRELLSKRGLQIIAPPQLELGPQVPLPTQELLATNPIFTDRGIVVNSPNPAALMLNVDEMHPGIEIRPTIPQDVASRLEGVAELTPPTVMVSGPKRALLNPAAPIEVIADLTVPQVPGTREIPAVPLHVKAPNDRLFIVTPNTVKAKVTLKSSSVRYTINSVAVFPFGPPDLLNRYNVNFPNGSFLSRVTVVGPQEEINKISSGDFMPRALVEVTSQDVRDPLPKSPSLYILPEHVTVSDEDKNRTITFKLVDPTQAE